MSISLFTCAQPQTVQLISLLGMMFVALPQAITFYNVSLSIPIYIGILFDLKCLSRLISLI